MKIIKTIRYNEKQADLVQHPPVYEYHSRSPGSSRNKKWRNIYQRGKRMKGITNQDVDQSGGPVG